MALKTIEAQCPYCGEPTELDIETLHEPQSFVEDCTVCCRPIQFHVSPGIDNEEEPEVTVSRSE